MPIEALHGQRYLRPEGREIAEFIADELAFLEFDETLKFYEDYGVRLPQQERALLGCNDRFFLLAALCHRKDALHPWVFARCREVEAEPDGRLDLWARYHFKSSVGTFAGIIQEIARDPEITVAIMSCTTDVARPFLAQIKLELETNEDLQATYPDVFWKEPKKQAPKWSLDQGITVKRRGNPKECTVEAFGVIDGMRTGKHYMLLDYDDLVTEKLVSNEDMIKKVTDRWELSDNLGTLKKTRKWHWGTRYGFGDTYGILLERGTLIPRIYPATDDGTVTGKPVLLTPEKWDEVCDAQRSTIAAQMLLNPLADSRATFDPQWFRSYDVIPAVMNVYIMVDPSMGRTARSDRTAIAVIGVDQGGNKYLLDGVRHRMKLSERYDHMKRLYQKWLKHPGVQVVNVGYERYGHQTDIEVIEDWMRKDKLSFGITELNFPREGEHSKKDRIRRLEPDFSKSRFYLPAVVFNPNVATAADKNVRAYWRIWTEAEDAKARAEAKAKGAEPDMVRKVGDIIYRQAKGLTTAMQLAKDTMQHHRVVTAIVCRDETGAAYDLTRVAMEEMRFHPVGTHEDLIDAMARIYDMQPLAPILFEDTDAEAIAYPDA